MAVDDSLKLAVSAATAQAVIAMLEGPDRDAILAKGVSEVMGGYEIKNLFAKQVQSRAAVIAQELIDSGKYDEQIRQALADGFAAVIAKVPAAAQAAITECLFGKESDRGYGGTSGLDLS